VNRFTTLTDASDLGKEWARSGQSRDNRFDFDADLQAAFLQGYDSFFSPVSSETPELTTV
jgi:hypothetical protein